MRKRNVTNRQTDGRTGHFIISRHEREIMNGCTVLGLGCGFGTRYTGFGAGCAGLGLDIQGLGLGVRVWD